jgi:hypothetical protein
MNAFLHPTGVLLALARHERPPSWSVRPRPANLGLGGVEAQLDPAGVGVGDHVGQGPQAQARLARDGKAAGGQQRPDLVDRASDGRAVHPVQYRHGLVGKLRRKTTRVARTRSQNASRRFGPAPAARRRRWPRRCCNAASWAMLQDAASSAITAPRCCREIPVKQGWDRASRTPWWLRHPRMITRVAHSVRVWLPGWEVTTDVDELGHHLAVRGHDDVDEIRHHS